MAKALGEEMKTPWYAKTYFDLPKNHREIYDYIEEKMRTLNWRDQYKFASESDHCIRFIHQKLVYESNKSIFDKLVQNIKSHPSIKKVQVRVNIEEHMISFEGISNYFIRVENDQYIKIVDQNKKGYDDCSGHDVDKSVDKIMNHITTIWTEQLLKS